MDKEELKELVRNKYTEIAKTDKNVNLASCCGATASSKKVYNIMTDDYSKLAGYQEAGDLGLGCGLPTEFAMIKEGDTVLDLGSGAGNDCFVARHETGPTGKVIGVDFSSAMVERARKNVDKLGYNNVEFREGDIEEMPVSDNSVDVVVSNCVLNLLPEKDTIFKEIFRVLKADGHFSISDIVLDGDIPDALKDAAEMYAGCVSGAIQKDDYLKLIEAAGFKQIQLQKEKEIIIPDDILSKYLSDAELLAFRNSESRIVSITVFGSITEKVITEQVASSCCPPGCC